MDQGSRVLMRTVVGRPLRRFTSLAQCKRPTFSQPFLGGTRPSEPLIMGKGSYFAHNIYRLTPILIAPRVMVSGVKPRWLSHLSRFLTLPSVTDSPVSAVVTPELPSLPLSPENAGFVVSLRGAGGSHLRTKESTMNQVQFRRSCRESNLRERRT